MALPNTRKKPVRDVCFSKNWHVDNVAANHWPVLGCHLRSSWSCWFRSTSNFRGSSCFLGCGAVTTGNLVRPQETTVKVSTHFVPEFRESVSQFDNSLFYSLLNEWIQSEEESLLTATPEQIYRYTFQQSPLISKLMDSTKNLLKLSLASHLDAPAVEAYYHFYRYTVLPSLGNQTSMNCRSWMELQNQKFCTPEQLKNALEKLKAPRLDYHFTCLLKLIQVIADLNLFRCHLIVRMFQVGIPPSILFYMATFMIRNLLIYINSWWNLSNKNLLITMFWDGDPVKPSHVVPFISVDMAWSWHWKAPSTKQQTIKKLNPPRPQMRARRHRSLLTGKILLFRAMISLH